ncbi:MAG: DUF1015 domain-containing protein [Cocleimonas sp.]|nr:DUF1015 domain-containing protein [Cocleimonas sp.]
MNLIRPFRGLRPAAGRGVDVVAPPYDVLNTQEAIERADGRPWSFLHISRPEIDLPEGTDPYDTSVYIKARENLDKMVDAGVLVKDDKASYYAYRLIMNGHEQVGLVAAASVAEYDTNRVRKHEFTRPMKEDDRVRQIDAVNGQTGPVLLAYPDTPVVDEILAAAITGDPDMQTTADDGVDHSLWVISDDTVIQQLTDAFDAMKAIYIADGHHRSASASRICATRKKVNAEHTGNEPYNHFLSVIFPHHQMKIFDYNRVVKDLNGLSEADLLEKIAEKFTISVSDFAYKPTQAAEYGLYLGGQWYKLQLQTDLIPQDDPVARLDVSLLADNLIAPLLGVADQRTDTRIDFVGGIRGLKGLEKRVDSGEMAIAFSLYATTMEDLMSVADANEVMPPKSTWFEPKLADGLVSHMLD